MDDSHKVSKKMAAPSAWFGWDSPVGLGIFLLTGVIALAILLYTILNLVVTVQQAMHPSDSSAAQEQQLEQEMEAQQAPATTGAGADTGAPAQ